MIFRSERDPGGMGGSSGKEGLRKGENKSTRGQRRPGAIFHLFRLWTLTAKQNHENRGGGGEGQAGNLQNHPTFSKGTEGTSLVVQWLRLCTPNEGGLGSAPGQLIRSHTPQPDTVK